MSLQQFYIQARDTPSDIYKHIETLAKYATDCEHITEFGVRTAVSTWGFMKGLTENLMQKKKLVSVDLDYHPNIEKVKVVAKQSGIDFTFIQGNDIKVNIEPTDLLFIDSWHVYGHLKRELETHAHKVKKYIILHDTTVDGKYGSSLRLKTDINKEQILSGYPREEITKGLWPAVEEFLEKNKGEWMLYEKFNCNNGLTILKRRYTPPKNELDWMWYICSQWELIPHGINNKQKAIAHWINHGRVQNKYCNEDSMLT